MPNTYYSITAANALITQVSSENKGLESDQIFTVQKDPNGSLFLLSRNLAKIKYIAKSESYSLNLNIFGFGSNQTKNQSKNYHLQFYQKGSVGTFLLSSPSELCLYRKVKSNQQSYETNQISLDKKVRVLSACFEEHFNL